MTDVPGLRELKKQRTRKLIAEAAQGLFFQHGFDAVTVTQIAAKAEVSVKTVFNYFGSKEDLFFDQDEPMVELFREGIRNRPAGTSLLEGIYQLSMSTSADIPEQEFAKIERFGEILRSTPALVAKYRQLQMKYKDLLVDIMVEEGHGETSDPKLQLTCAMLMGAINAGVDLLPHMTPRSREQHREQLRMTIDLLSDGFAKFGQKPDRPAETRSVT
ncbi:TetR/AcrR family transcriptional regulator [Pseudonocardiaceae bacterium YIM PH 21723]|nr:TetR/AcrR family transcriptional regulator [Pseudonocardiaceae bacterium YIM PH 21723]